MSLHDALPTIVVVGRPDVARAFASAGYPTVTGDPLDLSAVAGATRSMRMDGKSYVVLTSEPDGDRWAQWIGFEAAAHPTGVFGATQIPGCQSISLPSNTRQVLSSLGVSAFPDPVAIEDWQPVDDPFHPKVEPAIYAAPEPAIPVTVEPSVPTPAYAAPEPAVPEPVYTAPEPEPYVPQHAAPDWMSELPEPPKPALPAPSVPEPKKSVVEDVFGSPGDEFRYTRTVEALCPVIFVVAGKGGVGKTTWTLALAENAADRWPAKVGPDGKKSPPKIVVVDMNRGQPDVRKYLRIASAAVGGTPTIHDVAITGTPLTGLMGPTAINNVRVANLPPVNIGAVLGPPTEDKADPEVVTAAVYAATIRELRKQADLVVVDTQILEMADTSGLHDGVTFPLTSSDTGAWIVALTDSSMAGVSNLLERLASAQGRKDSPPDRAMVVLNRSEPASSIDTDRLAAHIAGRGTFLGSVPADPQISLLFEQGRVPYAAYPLRGTLDAALYRVTGMSVFDVPPPQASAGNAGVSSGGGKSWRFWRKSR